MKAKCAGKKSAMLVKAKAADESPAAATAGDESDLATVAEAVAGLPGEPLPPAPANLQSSIRNLQCREPAWLRCHRRAVRDAISALVYTALCGIELLRIRELHREAGTWMQWLAENWTMSHETARRYCALAEDLSARLGHIHPDEADWFLSLAELEDEMAPEDLQRAVGLLQQLAPGVATVRQLYVECGVLALPAKKVRRSEIADGRSARAGRPPTEPHVLLHQRWEKLPMDSKVSWLRDHLDEIRELLAVALTSEAAA